MIKAIIAGQPTAEILKHTGRLKTSREDLYEALPTEDLSETHRFVLSEILSHIKTLEAQIQRFEVQLLQGLAPWQSLLVLLQTVPGIDQVGAAMLQPRAMESHWDHVQPKRKTPTRNSPLARPGPKLGSRQQQPD